MCLSERYVFVENELDQNDNYDRRKFSRQLVPMPFVNGNIQNSIAEQQSEKADAEENDHPPERMVSDLEIIFSVQKKTA